MRAKVLQTTCIVLLCCGVILVLVYLSGLATADLNSQGLMQSPTLTPTIYLVETPQPFWVEPITSPTGLLSNQGVMQSPTLTPTLCPVGTPEPFWVEPITSPTGLLSQVVTSTLGNGEWVAVSTESGTFTVSESLSNGNRFLVPVALLPNTTHHLTVLGHVQRITWPNGCVYGDYTLSTTRDKFGTPLVIVQQCDACSLCYLPLALRGVP